jgi:hypothetical protein
MTQMTHQTRITTLVFALVFTNTALAAECFTNENKNNSSSNIIRNVNLAGYIDGSSAFTSDKDINRSSFDQQISGRQNAINRIDRFQLIEEQRHQTQEARSEPTVLFGKQIPVSISQRPVNNYLFTCDVQQLTRKIFI